MEEKKVYRLLKDTINQIGIIPAGMELEENGQLYCDKKSGTYFHKELVEENPEWFELVTTKRIEVKEIIRISKGYNGFNAVKITTNAGISIDKLPLIKQAIESVLNDDDNFFLGMDVLRNLGLKYTEQQLLEAEEKAFNAARLLDFGGKVEGYMGRGLTYNTFSDYKNQTNAQ